MMPNIIWRTFDERIHVLVLNWFQLNDGRWRLVCKSGQPPDMDACMNFDTFRELAMQVYLETEEQLQILT